MTYMRDGVTAYRQVANELKARMFNSGWKSGHRLPSLDVLATEFNVSRATLRQAVKLLVDEGLLSSTPGKGTFVIKAVKELALNAALDRYRDDKASFKIDFKSIDVKVALPESLKIKGKFDKSYVKVRKRHLLEDVPCAAMTVFVAEDVYERFPESSILEDRLVNLIRRTSDIKLSSGYERIEIVPLSADDALALDVTAGSPGVRMTRLLLDTNERTVFASHSVYRVDRFVYEHEMTGMVFYDRTS